jgi:hypothetical protein
MPDYHAQTNQNGITYITEQGEGGGGCAVLLIFLGFVVVGIAQLIYVKTGVNVIEWLGA